MTSPNDDHNSLTVDITFSYRKEAEKFYWSTPGTGFCMRTQEQTYHVHKTVENDRHAMYDLDDELRRIQRSKGINPVYLSHEYYTVTEDCEFKRRQEDCK